ncbi:MAG: DMT family transporter [Pseudomonadota bacterium]|jgi:drug/metabolite transporter (DMT)-like permease|nr:DMT family transporter [Pseudomonadota bacterium]MEC8292767.1 DMT family transporter [Pseudomonadota bacterium]
MTLILYIATVLIWGTTWIAIALQVGDVPVMVSVFYRFATAGVVFVLGLALLGRLQVPAARQQKWVLAQALCLFSLNFLCFYIAAGYLASGVISVIFSLATIFNAVNARIFFGDRVSGKTLLAGLLGLSGLALLFAGDLSGAGAEDAWIGIALASCGTLMFSFGNMVSRRNSANGLTPITANAWGMCYGALFLLALIFATGTPIILPSDPVYIGAMLYLAVIGSVVGFTTYLVMVARVGSAKAAYATVMFPIVALAISTVFEGYIWGLMNSAGLVLALCGNLVMFAPADMLSRLRPRTRSQNAA